MSGPGAPGSDGAPARVAVLASGSGTNLRALLERFPPSPPGAGTVARVGLVIGSRPEIGALRRAERAGVEHRVLEEADPDGEALGQLLRGADIDLVVLAGYLRLVPAPVVRAYRGRMLNVHPALLPAFGGRGMYGEAVHRAVLERGVRVTGVTVHFVDEEYDQGPVVAQWPVPVLEDDDAERLAARVLRVEHRLLPAVVEAVARGEVRLGEDGRVRWSRPLFEGDGFGIASPGEEPAAGAG